MNHLSWLDAVALFAAFIIIGCSIYLGSRVNLKKENPPPSSVWGMKTRLSELVNRPIMIRVPTDREQALVGIEDSATLMIVTADNTEILGQIEVDDLFDQDGNRFEVDIEI